jgi:hypothetical protein
LIHVYLNSPLQLKTVLWEVELSNGLPVIDSTVNGIGADASLWNIKYID